MAYVRWWAEGLDLVAGWNRYLYVAGPGDGRRARGELQRLLDQLRGLALAHGRRDIAVLLRRDPDAIIERGGAVPTLEEFRERQPEDFYGEAELLELYEAEIAQMVRDAEANREEDKKFHELVGTRNKADQLVHATRAAVKEHGGKIGGAAIGPIEEAVADLEKAMKGDDKAQIEAKITKLEQASQALFAAAQGGGDAGTPPPGPGAGAPDDVVDAEFTEVKDKK